MPVQKTLTKILKILKLSPSIPTYKKPFFPKIIPKSKFVYFLEKVFPKDYSKGPKSFLFPKDKPSFIHLLKKLNLILSKIINPEK